MIVEIKWERGLPSDTFNERLVLGTCWLDADSCADVLARLTPDDFGMEKHKRIFRAMGDVAAKGIPVDRITVATHLQATGLLESVDGLGYLVTLDDGLPQIFNPGAYIARLLDVSSMRKAILAMKSGIERMLGEGSPDGLEAIAETGATLQALAGGREKARTTLVGLADHIAATGGLQAFCDRKRVDGIPTPWPSLNAFYGGFSPTKFVVLAGRTSVGKSAMATQIALHAATLGHRVAMFSLEAGAASMWHRMCRQWGADAWAPMEIQAAASAIADLPLLISDAATNTVGAIKSAAEGYGLVIVDYLQLLSHDRKTSNRTEEVGAITRAIKLAAMGSRACWLVLSQLNRESEKEPEPRLTHLREAGTIEQDSNDAVLIHMDQDAQRSLKLRRGQPVPISLILAKQRDGEVGKVKMQWNPQRLLVEDHDQ